MILRPLHWFGMTLGLTALIPAMASHSSDQEKMHQEVDGAKVYATVCASCHQATGLGLEKQYPPLAGSEWALGSEGRLIRIILHGVTGEIEVQGETFEGLMPAWGPTLKDDEIAAVASYVRRSWGNKAPPVLTASVAKVRAAMVLRKVPWTAKELADVP